MSFIKLIDLISLRNILLWLLRLMNDSIKDAGRKLRYAKEVEILCIIPTILTSEGMVEDREVADRVTLVEIPFGGCTLDL